MDGDGLQVATEGVAGGDGAHQQAAADQVHHQVGQRQGECRAVGHHVGQAAARGTLGEGQRHHRHLAVHGAGHHGHATEGPVGLRVGELGGAGIELEAGVPELHDVVGARPFEPVAGQVPVHHVPATRPQRQVHRSGVEHHPVPHRAVPDQVGERVGAGRGAVGHLHRQTLEPGPVLQHLGHLRGAERGHQGVALPARGTSGLDGWPRSDRARVVDGVVDRHGPDRQHQRRRVHAAPADVVAGALLHRVLEAPERMVPPRRRDGAAAAGCPVRNTWVTG